MTVQKYGPQNSIVWYDVYAYEQGVLYANIAIITVHTVVSPETYLCLGFSTTEYAASIHCVWKILLSNILWKICELFMLKCSLHITQCSVIETTKRRLADGYLLFCINLSDATISIWWYLTHWGLYAYSDPWRDRRHLKMSLLQKMYFNK